MLSGSSTSSKAEDGSPRKSAPILSTPSKKKQRVQRLGLSHRLDPLVPANFRLVTDTAERHAHEAAPGHRDVGPGAELTHARRAQFR